LFTERPAFAADLTKPGIVFTRFGVFDPNPVAGETIIPRNYAQAPGSLIANLRVSRTFGFAAKGKQPRRVTDAVGMPASEAPEVVAVERAVVSPAAAVVAHAAAAVVAVVVAVEAAASVAPRPLSATTSLSV